MGPVEHDPTLMDVLKNGFGRERPSPIHRTASFPSGHTAADTFVVGALLFVLLPLAFGGAASAASRDASGTPVAPSSWHARARAAREAVVSLQVRLPTRPSRVCGSLHRLHDLSPAAATRVAELFQQSACERSPWLPAALHGRVACSGPAVLLARVGRLSGSDHHRPRGRGRALAQVRRRQLRVMGGRGDLARAAAGRRAGGVTGPLQSRAGSCSCRAPSIALPRSPLVVKDHARRAQPLARLCFLPRQ